MGDTVQLALLLLMVFTMIAFIRGLESIMGGAGNHKTGNRHG